jgi:ABC-type multidrug transport system fused ATPase/permease subunit
VRLAELLPSGSGPLEPPPLPPPAVAEATTIAGSVVFENVHFAYESRPDAKVLNGVSFAARPGELVAIIGGSGAGKSTVLSMVQRFCTPTSGRILIDGVPEPTQPLGPGPPPRSGVGAVDQEPLLFDRSVAENVGYGLDIAPSRAAIVAALEVGFRTLLGIFPVLHRKRE